MHDVILALAGDPASKKQRLAVLKGLVSAAAAARLSIGTGGTLVGHFSRCFCAFLSLCNEALGHMVCGRRPSSSRRAEGFRAVMVSSMSFTSTHSSHSRSSDNDSKVKWSALLRMHIS